MSKFFRCLILLSLFALALVSCKEPETEKNVLEKATDQYGDLIKKAKETESVLQKNADSLIRQADSLSIPR